MTEAKNRASEMALKRQKEKDKKKSKHQKSKTQRELICTIDGTNDKILTRKMKADYDIIKNENCINCLKDRSKKEVCDICKKCIKELHQSKCACIEKFPKNLEFEYEKQFEILNLQKTRKRNSEFLNLNQNELPSIKSAVQLDEQNCIWDEKIQSLTKFINIDNREYEIANKTEPENWSEHEGSYGSLITINVKCIKEYDKSIKTNSILILQKHSIELKSNKLKIIEELKYPVIYNLKNEYKKDKKSKTMIRYLLYIYIYKLKQLYRR